MVIAYILSYLFSFLMLYYISTLLQWNNYKIKRVFFNFHKIRWHFYFLIAPFLLYVLSFKINIFISLLIFIIYFICIFLWARFLDKKLVFTKRIQRLFFLNIFLGLIFSYLHYINQFDAHILDYLFLSLIFSYIIEKFLNIYYYKKAKNKINSLKNCKVILITASYGKTSIKHYLAQILSKKYRVHYAKGSINTTLGLCNDINNNLDTNTQILIIEAGARKKGDILEITKLTQPHFVIIGQIGTAHLEFFKNKENILNCKKECLQSSRLEYKICHSSVSKEYAYDLEVSDITATLDALNFTINHIKYTANLLGEFNAYNLAACIKLALKLNFNYEELQNIIKNIHATEHRMQIITKTPKFIIDDGYNGNYDGMSQSYNLISSYNKGRKILVSPGIIEVNKEINVKLCKIINQCFDFAIITGSLNAKIFEENLTIKKIILKNKDELQNILAKHTKENDLILFSNDAPKFI